MNGGYGHVCMGCGRTTLALSHVCGRCASSLAEWGACLSCDQMDYLDEVGLCDSCGEALSGAGLHLELTRDSRRQ